MTVPMPSITEEGRRAGAARRRPGLAVELTVAMTGDPASPALRVRVDVTGGDGPVRVFLYIDGDFVESWVLLSAASRFPPSQSVCALAHGRHAVTARAIDSAGRWGGDSAVFDVEERPVPA